jgi:hypothetical protein
MNREVISRIARELVAEAQRLDQAKIFEGQQNPPEVQKFTLDLSEARDINDPLIVGFPFKSVFVGSASNTSLLVNMRVFAKDAQQSSFPLQRKDAVSFENPITQAFLHWDAFDVNDTIDLYFFRTGDFRSGSQISVSSGGVTVSDGSILTTNVHTLAATTATSILNQDTSRKTATIQNNTTDFVFLGTATINGVSDYGIKLSPGQAFNYNNTAALYAYANVIGDVTTVEGY